MQQVQAGKVLQSGMSRSGLALTSTQVQRIEISDLSASGSGLAPGGGAGLVAFICFKMGPARASPSHVQMALVVGCGVG